MHIIPRYILCIKCKRFREIESETVKLFKVLDRHTARHLFRSSNIKYSAALTAVTVSHNTTYSIMSRTLVRQREVLLCTKIYTVLVEEAMESPISLSRNSVATDSFTLGSYVST